jgi:hypothetical protein
MCGSQGFSKKLMSDGHGAQRTVHFFLLAHHDSHHGRKPFANNLQQCRAVHFRHVNIGNNHIERFLRQQIER